MSDASKRAQFLEDVKLTYDHLYSGKKQTVSKDLLRNELKLGYQVGNQSIDGWIFMGRGATGQRSSEQLYVWRNLRTNTGHQVTRHGRSHPCFDLFLSYNGGQFGF